jgi:hypothetical protein
VTPPESLDPRRKSALARFVLSRRGVPPTPKAPPSVLVLARPGAESDELFSDLSEREDLCLLRVANAAAANITLREMPVALVIACPEIPAAAIESVLGELRGVRAGTPVLAIRSRGAAEPAGWRDRGVGVLRMPLLPGVLARSVDVVLGMKRKS